MKASAPNATGTESNCPRALELLTAAKRYLMKCGVPAEDAEDIAVSVLARVVDKAQQEHIENMTCYLWRAVRNAHASWKEQTAKYPETLFTELGAEGSEELACESSQFAAEDPALASLCGDERIAAQIARYACETLQAHDAAQGTSYLRIVQAHFFEEASYGQIAAELQLPIEHVKRLLTKALRLLHTKLQHDNDARDLLATYGPLARTST